MKISNALFSRSVCALALALCAAALHAETLEDVEKILVEKASAWKSMRYAKEVEGIARDSTSHATSTAEIMRLDGKWKKREEIHLSSPASATERAFELQRIMVNDGDAVYTVEEVNGEKKVWKRPANDSREANFMLFFFKRTHAKCDLTLLTDAVINGDAVYVIEAKPKAPGKEAVVVNSFNKETGMCVQSTFTYPNGTVVTQKNKNIELNVEIPAEHFVFTPPKGVPIREITKPPNEE